MNHKSFYLLIFIILALFIGNAFADLSKESTIKDFNKITNSTNNIKTYDSLTNTVTIKDLTGKTDYATIKLLTPLNIQVGLGYNKVAEFEINSKINDSNFMKAIYLFDKTNNLSSVKRSFDLREEIIYVADENSYKEVCIKDKNGDDICKPVFDKVIKVSKTRYDLFNSYSFPIGKKKLSIWVDTKQGDFVEWIPDLFGVAIPEWASWKASLDTNLRAYYKLDEASGNIINAVNPGTNDCNALTNVTQNVSGIINKAVQTSAGNGSTDCGSGALNIVGKISFNAWVYVTAAGGYDAVVFDREGAGFQYRFGFSGYASTPPNRVQFLLKGTTWDYAWSDNNYVLNQWNMITGTWDGSTDVNAMKVYLNGVLAGAGTFVGTQNTSTSPTRIYGNESLIGKIDEAGIWQRALTPTEITLLYNSGAGLGYHSYSQARIDWNIYASGGTTHLTDVDVDCNVNTMDVNLGDSPFSSAYVDQNTNFTCNFTKTGYDANNGITGVADSNKTVTVYLTQTLIPQARITFNVYKTGTTTDLNTITFDANVNALDLTNQTSPFNTIYQDQNTNVSATFSRTGYDSNTISFVMDSNKTITVYLYAFSGNGSGTSNNPYEITNWNELQQMNKYLDNSTIYFKLMNDLNSETADYATYASSTANTNTGWLPIGNSTNKFDGNLNGNKHKINNLIIYRYSPNSGLFGFTNTSFYVYDLYMEKSSIQSDNGQGTLVGQNYGTIERCSATDGNILYYNLGSGPDQTGGLTGRNYGSIINSYSGINVTGDQWTDDVGGLIGYCGSSCVITNSYSKGAVISTDGTFHSDSGGLVGHLTAGGSSTNSFWDINTSQQTTSALGVGKTTIEMKDFNTFNNADWNIELSGSNLYFIWVINHTINYPLLNISYGIIPPLTEISGNTYATWTNTNQTITLTCIDSCASTAYSLDGGAWTAYTVPFTISTDRNHSIDYNSTDVAGNVEATKRSYAAIDKTSPTTTFAGATGLWQNTTLSLTLSCVDTNSGCASTNYRINSGAWTNYTGAFGVTDGNNKIDYNSTDNAGNIEATKTNYAAQDRVNPSIGQTYANGFTIVGTQIWGTGIIAATASDATSDINASGCYYTINNGSTWIAADKNATHCYKSVTISAGTTPQFNIKAIDNANNTGTGTATIVYTADNVAPTTSISGCTSGWHTTNQTIQVSSTDATSGVSNIYLLDSNGTYSTSTTTITYEISTDGNHVITYWSKDNANNLDTNKLSSCAVDVQAPSVGNTTLTGSGFTVWTTYFKGNGKIIGGTATDSGTGIDTTTCYVQYFAAGAWFSGNWNVNHCESDSFTAADTTIYTMNTRVTDNSGHTGTGTATAAYTADSTAPTSTLTVTDINATTKNFGITCSDAGSGCKTTYYRFDSEAELSGTPPIDYNKNFSIGNHTITYFSKDNLDTNETPRTYSFTTSGAITINLRDENSGADLTSVTTTLNGITKTIDSGGYLDLNGLTATTTNYLITFIKTGYGTRYYQFDGNNVMPNWDINFLLLPITLGLDLPYKLYESTGTTTLPNTYFEIKRVDRNNWSIGRLKTSATATTTIFTNVFDQNYSEIIADTNTYSMVDLSVLYPKDEETLFQITNLWKINTFNASSEQYLNLNATQHLYLIPNLDFVYTLKIKDMNTSYFERTYTRQFFGNPLTATLQPYLISTATGLLTQIKSIQPYTLLPIANVNTKIYRVLSGLGKTLVEETTTDGAGIANVILIQNQSYIFDVYYQGLLKFSENITGPLVSGTTIYIRISDLNYVVPKLGSGSLNVIYSPTKSGTTTTSLDQQVIAQDTNGTFNITQIKYWITNTDVNGIRNNDLNLCLKTIFAPGLSYTNNIDINYLSERICDGNVFDKTGSLIVYTEVTTTNGTLLYKKEYTAPSEWDLVRGLGFNLRPMFGCSATSNPLIPCAPLLLAALFISIVIAATSTGALGYLTPTGFGFMFVFVMGIFTYLAWVPYILYAIMVAALLVLIIAEGGRRI